MIKPLAITLALGFVGLSFVHASQSGSKPNPRKVHELLAGIGKHPKENQAALVKLGPSVFAPAIAAFLDVCHRYDQARSGPNSSSLYDDYHLIARVLDKITTPGNLPSLVKSFKTLPAESSAKPIILYLITKVGDPLTATKMCVQATESEKVGNFEMYESTSYIARDYVLRSTERPAIEALTRWLQNPKASRILKEAAYTRAAATGDPKAVQAVIHERDSHQIRYGTIQAIANALANPKLTKLVAKTTVHGATWGLLKCGVLGSHGDLWLARKAPKGWIHPLFVGVSTEGNSRWVKPPRPNPTFEGITAEQLVKGKWVSALIGNPKLAKDQDGDGLTDIEERRLSTNPMSRDTDGDGVPDGVDPFPNAGLRPQTDDERVLAAVFEAQTHFGYQRGAALIKGPAGIKPLEFAGRSGPTIWADPRSKAWSHPLEACYEQGVAFIRFGSSEPDKPVIWNRDHTIAQVNISVYYGGLNGTGYSATVKKFGKEWLVISCRVAYMS